MGVRGQEQLFTVVSQLLEDLSQLRLSLDVSLRVSQDSREILAIIGNLENFLFVHVHVVFENHLSDVLGDVEVGLVGELALLFEFNGL